MIAASRENSSAVGQLIEKGADMNIKNDIGNSALMIAAQAGSEQSIRSLLQAGADVDARNNKREQAIDLAESGGHTDIVVMIQRYKEDNKLFGIF